MDIRQRLQERRGFVASALRTVSRRISSVRRRRLWRGPTNKSTVERGFAANAYAARKDKSYNAIISKQWMR